MLLKRIYDENLAQASYLLAQDGQALVIDPARDIRPYLNLAEANELAIIAVVETHIHADFVSGGRELAHATGATLYVSGLGEGELAYTLPAEDNIHYLRDNDTIMVGGIKLEALHTLGHSPEHLIFQVTDANETRPMGLFTGDCLFVGGVGRPDLLKGQISEEEAARQQYANIQRLAALPDYLQVWPGHGAGSACGKDIGDLPASTIGYEKLTNPAFQHPDQESFVVWLLQDQPETPTYFAQVKQINRRGAELLYTLDPVTERDEDTILAALGGLDATLIDARPVEQYAEQHIVGTINIPADYKQFTTWAGYYVNYDNPVFLIAEAAQIPDLVARLRAIGIDDIEGYFTPAILVGYDHQIIQIGVEQAAQKQTAGTATILDVRTRAERRDQHIPGSRHIEMGEIPQRMDELPQDQPVILQCGAGIRSQVVASLLEDRGYDVLNLAGGIDAWQAAGLPLESDNETA